MALSHEDKKDVQKHLGKALANKIGHVTRDSSQNKAIHAKMNDKKKYPIHEKDGTWLSPGHWRGKNVGKGIKSTSESRSGFADRDYS